MKPKLNMKKKFGKTMRSPMGDFDRPYWACVINGHVLGMLHHGDMNGPIVYTSEAEAIAMGGAARRMTFAEALAFTKFAMAKYLWIHESGDLYNVIPLAEIDKVHIRGIVDNKLNKESK